MSILRSNKCEKDNPERSARPSDPSSDPRMNASLVAPQACRCTCFCHGGGHLPWFWVRMCGWSPRTPPHSYTRPSEKHDPFIYLPYRKLTPFIYYFWKLTPFIYCFSNFTHSYTFWVKKIPHWYTFDVKMIPIHILGCLKSIPHSSRTSVYTFIMEVTPPWFLFIQCMFIAEFECIKLSSCVKRTHL